ncbi:hypothetical protein V6N13_120367 [Hibiscus sabdariffa]|uniref:Uncharacterized protein n=1 Tax=Hibiscus sabdariffa TaxID=183260 RepID=A0ABR2E450_9ROSI
MNCSGYLLHRSSTLPVPFTGLQNCLRSCSEVILAVWRYFVEKSRCFSIVFEVVKEARWKRVIVRVRIVFSSDSCFLEGNNERVDWLGPRLASGQNGVWYNVARRYGFLLYVSTGILRGARSCFSRFHCFRRRLWFKISPELECGTWVFSSNSGFHVLQGMISRFRLTS